MPLVLCILILPMIWLISDRYINHQGYVSFCFYFLSYIVVSSLLAYSHTSFLSLLQSTGLAGSAMSIILLLQERKHQRCGFVLPREHKYIWVLFPLMVIQLLISFVWGFLMETYFKISQEQELMRSLLEVNEIDLWIFSFFVVVMVVPLIEEILFRGILIHVFCEKKISNVWNVLCNGFFFGLMHMSTLSAVVPLTCFGCMLAYLRLHSHSIVPSLVLHMLNNAVVVIYFYIFAQL